MSLFKISQWKHKVKKKRKPLIDSLLSADFGLPPAVISILSVGKTPRPAAPPKNTHIGVFTGSGPGTHR
jgi:hypothetical protein